jgi:ADP-heptose:LPS heptosyltransferase
VDRVLALLAPLGVRGPGGRPRLPDGPGGEEARSFLREAGLRKGGFAFLHPATSAFGRHKRWAPDRFGALAAAIREEWGLPSVATWGPGERELAMAVVAASAGAARPGPRTRSLLALAHLAGLAAVVVAADTGALQLSDLLGVPSVGLYGPKDPRVYAPRGERTAIVFKGVDCSPCPRRSCDDPVCMKTIEIDDVLRAVREVLPVPEGERPDPSRDRTEGRPGPG